MSREEAYLRMLDSSANLQRNMAAILDAKASEAEKVRNWICNHVTCDSYSAQQDQLKEMMDVHDLLIEVIDGVIKYGQGMTNVLKAILRDDSESGGDMLGSMLGSGGLDMSGFGGKT